MGGHLSLVARVNTVSLEFTGRAGYPAVELVMCDMLRVPVDDVYSIELVTAHRVIIKFVGEVVYCEFLRRYEGRSLSLPDGAGSVSITDHSGALTYVCIGHSVGSSPRTCFGITFSGLALSSVCG